MAVGQGALEDLVEEGRGDSRGVRMVPGVLPDETRSRSVYTQRY